MERSSRMANRLAWALAAAWLACGWAPARADEAPKANPFGKLTSAKLYRNCLNPDRGYTRPKRESLDDALRLFRINLATDRYMLDSLGFAQAQFEVYAASPEASDSLRNRVVGMLQSLRLRFQTGSADHMDLGPAEASWLNPGPIPIASAYFALRDSLMGLRTGSFQVMIKETPYRSPLTSNGDSTLAFLKRLRDLAGKEDLAFGKTLMENLRLTGTDYEFNRGVDCTIEVGRLLSAKERREKPPAQTSDYPRLRLPSREQPVLIRLDSIQALAWISLGLSAGGFLMGLSFWLAPAIRRRRGGKPTPSEGAANK